MIDNPYKPPTSIKEHIANCREVLRRHKDKKLKKKNEQSRKESKVLPLQDGDKKK